MAATKITGYAAITQIDPAVDPLVIVDVSDTSMDPTGTDKKMVGNFLRFAVMGDCQGLELTYNSATVLRVNTGRIGVNGKDVSFSQTDYTSGSTMKDIANATVTLAASKCYWMFISDAGVIGIEINDSTGDGATPVYDTTYGYWKAASTGLAWRRIGKFWTDGSSNIRAFSTISKGRSRQMLLNNHQNLLVISAGTAANYGAGPITITPYITGDDASYILSVLSGAAVTTGIVNISVDGTTNFLEIYVTGTGTVGNWENNTEIPNTGSLAYNISGAGASATAYVAISGVAFVV